MTTGTDEGPENLGSSGEAAAAAITDVGRQRLEGQITACRAELESLSRRDDSSQEKWWAERAHALLDEAETAAGRDDIEQGWYHLHAAERMTLHGLQQGKGRHEVLEGKAQELRVEAEHAALSWRATAATARLTVENGESSPSVSDLRSAAKLLHEGYHRIHLKRQHLQSQVTTLKRYAAITVIAVIAYSLASAFVTVIPSPLYEFTSDSSTEAVGFLVYVALFGVLGAAVFGLWSLTTRPTAPSVPQYLSGRQVATVRLLIGASSALAIFFFARSMLISVNVGSGLNSGQLLIALAFVAGYSERLVHSAVESVADTAEDDPSNGDQS